MVEDAGTDEPDVQETPITVIHGSNIQGVELVEVGANKRYNSWERLRRRINALKVMRFSVVARTYGLLCQVEEGDSVRGEIYNTTHGERDGEYLPGLI